MGGGGREIIKNENKKSVTLGGEVLALYANSDNIKGETEANSDNIKGETGAT